jgi:hypothetical protein
VRWRRRLRGSAGRAPEVLRSLTEAEVLRYDPGVGLGIVRLADGQLAQFHCMALANPSREIGVGCRVRVQLKAGFGGELEVAWLGQSS